MLKPAKPGPGRPATLNAVRNVSVRMADTEVEQAKQLGAGNVSRGVRVALDQVKTASKG